MIGLIVVTHGDFGEGLVKSAQSIVGAEKYIWALSLKEGDGLETVREKLQMLIDEGKEECEGNIILVDMFGGTPANASLRFATNDKVEIISGVNLPMLLVGINFRKSMALKDLAETIRKKGAESVLNIKEIFLKRMSEGQKLNESSPGSRG